MLFNFHFSYSFVLYIYTTSGLQHSQNFKVKFLFGTYLRVQWIRIHLPMQGTYVQSLVWEGSTCPTATKPMHHNHWAHMLEPLSPNYWARVLQLLKPALSRARALQEKTLQWEACAPQLEKAPAQQWSPSAAKYQLIKKNSSLPKNNFSSDFIWSYLNKLISISQVFSVVHKAF